MRWGPGRSWIAWWKRMQTLRVPAGDGCGCGGAEDEIVNTLRNGIGAPDPALGIDGDFYIDTSAETIYGPKGGIGGVTPGAWGSPTSLIGPAGSDASIDIPDPVNGILAKATDHTVRTAAHASISADGGLELRTSGAAVVAGVGLIRCEYNPGVAILSAKDSGAVDRGVIQQTATSWFWGSAAWNSVLTGLNVVISSPGGVSVNAPIWSFTTGPALVDMDSEKFVTNLPRFGTATPWGASEGTGVVTATGTHALVAAEYVFVHVKFTGAGTGTFTFPAPSGTSPNPGGQTYLKWLEETGGSDKVITIGSGVTYTLKANTNAWVRFSSTGVYPSSSTGNSPAGEQVLDVTGTNGTFPVDLGNGRIIKVIGTNAGTPIITITPQPNTEALADLFTVRYTSGSGGATITTAIGGKTTATQPAGTIGQWMATPDGIKGYYVTSGGSIVGFAV